MQMKMFRRCQEYATKYPGSPGYYHVKQTVEICMRSNCLHRWHRLNRSLERVTAVHDGSACNTLGNAPSDRMGIAVDVVRDAGADGSWMMTQKQLQDEVSGSEDQPIQVHTVPRNTKHGINAELQSLHATSMQATSASGSGVEGSQYVTTQAAVEEKLQHQAAEERLGNVDPALCNSAATGADASAEHPDSEAACTLCHHTSKDALKENPATEALQEGKDIALVPHQGHTIHGSKGTLSAATAKQQDQVQVSP